MKRDGHLSIRVPQRDKDRWQKLCHKLDLDLSEFVYNAVNDYEQKIKQSRTEPNESIKHSTNTNTRKGND